ncbi:YheT family hydrolase [Paludibacterium yongneupense]|uniref:YheT family hydrolase n=1 Tax=Paludibacterium yongneupense TaxID=400061 RepID=UPI00042352EF|nr:alpha/beta fold hydrolase [Paludibacterium yongneupense]
MSYRAPPWLIGGHAQTLWPALLVPVRRPGYRREEWDTPDGARIAVDRIDGRADAPLVVLFHGLEGSSDSHYARALMSAVQDRGWNGAVPHFRGCGGMDNPLSRAYHAGDAAEIEWIVRRLAGEREVPLLAAAVSLGGSMLLNYLAQAGTRALPHAAVAVSTPLDMIAASTRLNRGLTRMIYTRMFLATLKPKALRQLERHPGLFDGERIRHASTFREFDDLFTAPLHGFADAMQYWTQTSSKQRLGHIARPTLIINARNDPFLPEHALPRQDEVSPMVELDFPPHGGHVGFATGPFPGRIDWLPRRILDFFERHLAPDGDETTPRAPHSGEGCQRG